MSKYRTIDQFPDEAWRGKRVLVRVDFNVPLAEGRVSDDTRIRATLPTIQYLRERGTRVVLASHLGRPRGLDRQFSLAPVAVHLGKMLDIEVPITAPGSLKGVGEQVQVLPEGGMVLLENIRFFPEEEKNDSTFARQLADLADIFVNDAFGSAHRAHASTTGVATYLPAYAGFLMQRELRALGELLDDPQRPFAAIIGGAKVSTKMAVLERLVQKVDTLIIGGGMAFTFLKAQGLEVGASLVEVEYLDYAGSLLKTAGSRLLLPTDVVVGDSFQAEEAAGTVDVKHIPADRCGMDIGTLTVSAIRDALKVVKTVLWNGPMGVFEKPAFAGGTHQLAHLLAEATDHGCITVVGGGDSVAAIEGLGLADRFTHISTGGGASLEFLEGKELPGVAALAQPAGKA